MSVTLRIVLLLLAAAAAASQAEAADAPYVWRNVEIVGGGFVSGIIPHPTQKGLMYARTDIGGAYRRDSAAGKWVALLDWVDQERWNYTGIESVAVDPADPDLVYIAAGTYTNDWAGPGAMLRSSDRGDTWQVAPMTFKMGGNEDGRGNGERLTVDPNRGAVLYFGSRRDGLWRSTDGSVTWEPVKSFPETGDTKGIGIVFVLHDKASGSPGRPTPTIYAGVSSSKTSLYRSTDAGQTWSPVPNQPGGFVPHHAAWDAAGGTLYVTCGNGPGPNDVTDGAVYKLDTKWDTWTDVTPVKPHPGDKFGYAGVTADPRRPGVVMVSTLDRWAKVDDIFRSTDGGRNWTGLREKAVRDASGAPWLKFGKPEVPFGHWVADVEIDPFDPDHLLYVTGWGMWESKDLTAADKGGATHWAVAAGGINECVVNEVVSPPAGAHALSVVWDLDGFRHVDLDRSPPSGFFTPHYGRNTSIDFAENAPDVVARVYGGQEMGGTQKAGTGGSYSLDNGQTWTAFPSKPAGSRNDGTVAVSADGKAFAWTPDRGAAHVSHDRGTTWTRCEGLPDRLRVVSDRADGGAFYAFDPGAGTLLASTDRGRTFAARATRLPQREGRGSDGGYLRAVPGHAGHLWLATPAGVLSSDDGGKSFRPVAGPQSARRVGFGKAVREGADYPAVYLVGSVGGTYGFFRSDDRGGTWTRVNDDRHVFGEITSITGDPRVPGRVYVSSRNRGILYGEPAGAARPAGR